MFGPISTALAASLAVAGTPVAAATYDLALTFAAATPQRTVAPGESPQVNRSATVSDDWHSTSPPEGAILETPAPNPAYATWTLCRLNPFAACGAEPPLTITVRNGSVWWTESRGTLGFVVEGNAGAASVQPTLAWDISAVVPEPGTVAAGEAFSLRPDSAASAGEMNLSPFQLGASLGIFLTVTDTFHGEQCVANLCRTWSYELDTVDSAGELVSITPQDIRFFDGFMPPLGELTIPVGNVRADLRLGVLPPYTQVTFSNGLPPVPPGSLGLAVDVAAVEVNVPAVEATGVLGGDGILRAVGEDDYADILADVDMLFGFGGGIIVDVGPFEVSVDAHDIEAGHSLDTFTEVALASALGVRLEFSRPVTIEGQGAALMWEGLWNAMPDFSVTGPTLFTPTFHLDAEMTTRVGLQYGWGATREILKGSVQLGPITAGFGPVEADRFEIEPDFFRLALLDTTFAFDGFADLGGTPFWVIPADAPAVAPVPLPATGPALLTLVAGTAALRLSRRAGRTGRG